MKKTAMFFFSLIVWFLFTGAFSLPVIGLGIIISVIVAFLFGDMTFRFLSQHKPSFFMIFKKVYFFLLVIGAFIYDAYISAIKVSLHAFELNPSFSPGIVKIKTHLKNIAAISILANLITLTPGTLVLDFDVLDRNFYIHWIDVKTEEEAEIKKQIIGKHEKWIFNIFS